MKVLAVLMVLAVLESALPSFCLSFNIQDKVTVLTVLVVSAVVAVSVVTHEVRHPFSLLRAEKVGATGPSEGCSTLSSLEMSVGLAKEAHTERPKNGSALFVNLFC